MSRNISFVDGFTSETIPASARANTSGPAGSNGVGITSVTLTNTVGRVETYTILFTNATTTTFDLSNGQDGSNGTNGTDGTTLRSGNGAPSNTLGENGEFYVDTGNSRLYGPKASNTWPSTFISLIGPIGPRIVGASFSGDDIVFVDNASPANNVVIVDGKTDITGDVGLTGPQGDSGTALILEIKTTTFTVEDRRTYNINPTASFTITLPVPSLNFVFTIKDISGNLNQFNVTVARPMGNSALIDGLDVDRVLQADYGAYTFYSDGTNWFIL